MYQCYDCNKVFKNRTILQLHMQIHQANKKAVDTFKSQEEHKMFDLQPAKKPGLTKLRLEDYLRCDACSCIYLFEVDYHKHMKNFHHIDSPNKKTKSKSKKRCKSCCRNCKCKITHPDTPIKTRRQHQSDSLHCNIKDRWSKLMEGIKIPLPVQKVKTEPLDEGEDYSDLLSQVEVRIKTEPIDYTE